jgi:hypothetical protein
MQVFTVWILYDKRGLTKIQFHRSFNANIFVPRLWNYRPIVYATIIAMFFFWCRITTAQSYRQACITVYYYQNLILLSPFDTFQEQMALPVSLWTHALPCAAAAQCTHTLHSPTFLVNLQGEPGVEASNASNGFCVTFNPHENTPFYPHRCLYHLRIYSLSNFIVTIQLDRLSACVTSLAASCMQKLQVVQKQTTRYKLCADENQF